MVKELPLKGGGVALVDDEDYPLLSRYMWQRAGRFGYAVTTMQFADGKNRTIYLHKLILGGFTEVDHIDREKVLDCRKENLRRATHQQNGWNKGPNRTHRGKPRASRYKGVQYRPLRGVPRWFVQIMHVEEGQPKQTGKMIRVGYFFDETEAAKAYNAMARKLRGEWAWQNPVPDDTPASLESCVAKERDELLALQESGRATYAQRKRHQALVEAMEDKGSREG